MSVVVKYGDIAIGARDSFVPSSESGTSFSQIEKIQKNVSFPNYQNACDYLSVPLDGSALPIPNVSSENIGFWSKVKSDSNGSFEIPVLLNFVSDGYYTSPGITLYFDDKNGVYAKNLEIIWKRNGQEISRKTFNPTSAIFFCENRVELYNEIVITVYSVNMPLNALKIKSIEYGNGTEFTGEELKLVKIKQEISQISSELPISTGDIVIHSKNGREYFFQDRQPIDIYSDGKLLLKTFVESFKKTNKNEWSISGEDYIGLMDGVPFYGGVYTIKNASELIQEIFATAKVPYELSTDFVDSTVRGYIPYTTCREALEQVLFAIGAVANTSESENVKIYKLSNEISQEIQPWRVIRGQTSTEKGRVSKVEVVSHSYRKTQDTVEVYNASTSQTGEEIFITFSEPLHGLSITNGTIIESGANHAVISASEGCVLTGKRYEHTMVTKFLKNPLVPANATENVVSVKDATLVSDDNVDNVLNLCYNHIINKSNMNMRIVDGKHVVEGKRARYDEFAYDEMLYDQIIQPTVKYDKPNKLGDLVVVTSEKGKKKTARITKQSFSLVGNIKVKDTVLE